MTKSKQRQSLRGAVLIMILTVMVVLIIMLMATLTVVTTAGKRVYTKFEENQAYYTARSALDVFTNQMFTDSSFKAYDDSNAVRLYQYTDSAGAPATADMKQGLALQLDLYKIMSSNENGAGEDWGLAENPLVTDQVFGMDASGNPRVENTNFSVVSGVNYMEYRVTFPAISDGSDSYGRIVDVDSSNKQIATIKVEVLDRKLDMNAEYDHATFIALPENQQKAAIAGGSRSKDKMKIRITSTVQLLETEGVAVVIIDTTQIDPPAASNAINSLGTLVGSGAGMVAAGGASSLSTGEILVDAAGTAGSLFALGTLHWNSSGTSSFDENAGVYSKLGIKFTNSQTVIPSGPDLYFYTEGAFEVTSSFTAGTDANPINIICDEFKYNNGVNIKGNIFTNKIVYGGSNGYQKLWDPNQSENLSLHVKDLYVSPDIVDISSDGKVYFKVGNIPTNTVLYGSVYIDRNGDGVYTGANEVFDKSLVELGVTKGTAAFDILKQTPETTENGIELKVKLPADLASGSRNTINLPTPQSKFGEYFDASSFDVNGQLIDPTNLNSNIITAEAAYKEMAGTSAETLNVCTNELTGPSITASGILKPNNTGSKAYSVDTTSGPITIQLKPDEDYQNITLNVTGTNPLYIVMPEAADNDGDGNPDAQTYILGENFNIFTDEITSTSNQEVKWDQGAPNIHIFVGSYSKLQLYNNNFLTGYIYMPLSEFENSGGNNGLSKKYEYRGTETTKNYFLAGSITCGAYSTGGSNTGVCYIDPEADGADEGDPHLALSPSRYTRK